MPRVVRRLSVMLRARCRIVAAVVVCVVVAAAVVVVAGTASPASSVSRGIVFASGGRIELVQPDGTALKAVTSYSVTGRRPRWLASGTLVEFLAYGQSEGVWLMHSDGTLRRRLSRREVVTSPDGRRTAEFATDSIIVVRAAGGRMQRRIHVPLRRTEWTTLDSSYYPHWSPDGRRLAFPVYGPGAVTARLVVADTHTSATRTITPRGVPRDPIEALWSPDGRMIATIDDEAEELWVMRADGSNRRRIARDVTVANPVAWSPDGRRLAFTSWFGSSPRRRPYGLLVADVATARPRTLAQLPRKTPSGEHDDGFTSLAWSPDGRRLAFTYSRGLAVISVAGGRPRLLAARSANWEASADWAPSRQILFAYGKAEPFGHGDIAIVDPDNGRLKTLTEARFDRAPSWSPNGRMLLFERLSTRGTDIYVARPDGSHQRRVAAGEQGSWSANAAQIRFVRGIGIYRVAAAGGQPLRVATGSTPAWSPHGQKVAFLRHHEVDLNERETVVDHDLLLTADVGGSVVRVLRDGDKFRVGTGGRAGGAETYSTPQWSPDGTTLALGAFNDAYDRYGIKNTVAYHLLVIDQRTGAASASERRGQYAWLPSGRTLVQFAQGKLVFVDTATGTEHAVDAAADLAPEQIIFSADGAHAAVGTGSRIVTFDLVNPAHTQTSTLGAGLDATPLEFSGDGRLLAVGTLYRKNAPARSWVFVIDPDGRTHRLAEGEHPDWRP